MGTKEIKEADVKQYARRMFKDKGYYYFPVNQGMFSRAGIPDDCLCVDSWFVAVEFKSELRWGNKATLPRPTQVLEMNKIWAAGGAAFVVDRYRLVALMGALSDPWIFRSWNQAFREIMPTELVAVAQQHARQSRDNGLLFAKGFNDQILLREGQLERWLHYLKDNPRRLLMKREHPDLFRVQRGLTFADMSFSAIGNRFLLERPLKLQIQCSRSITETELQVKLDSCLHAARQGAVLVSPAISKGEKAIMRAAFEEGLPLIYLQENGFTDLAKPGGKRMDACASGQLLILAPWEHHNEKFIIKRGQCLALNDMARLICSKPR